MSEVAEVQPIEISQETKDILKEFGLDFTIFKKPQAIINGGFDVQAINLEDGQEAEFNTERVLTLNDDAVLTLSDYYTLVNSKTFEELNSVKAGYTISQNDEIVEMVLQGMQVFGDQLSVHQAMSLNGGRKVLIQLKIEGTATVGKDTVTRYITIIDSNDGSTGLSVGVSNQTLSCMNQFFAFYKAGSRFRHTASLKQKIAALPGLITGALENEMEIINSFQRFAETPCDDKLVHKLVKHLLGIDRTCSELELADASTKKRNMMDKLYENIEHQMHESDKGKNLWGLFSGITRWTTYDKQAPSRENGRMESLAGGTNYKTNMDAFQFLERQLQA